MSIYKAPDGNKYNIPSEPNERAQFVVAVKEKYGEDLDQTTALGQVGEFAKAIPRGAAGLALDVPTGIVGYLILAMTVIYTKVLKDYKIN